MVISDLTLIKLFFSSREIYTDYKPYIRIGALTKEAQVILKDLGLFYDSFQEVNEVEIDKFATWFHQVQHPDLNEVQHSLYNELFKRVEAQVFDEGSDYTKVILQHFKTEDFKARLKKQVDEGFSPEKVKKIIEQYESEIETDEMEEFEENSLESILSKEIRTDGLQWRLHCLQKSIGPIIKGDFGVVAAYVETGKTSWLASEVANFAHQLKEGTVLWFNNEQTNDRVQKRIWCAALGVSETELAADVEESTRKYIEYMNGDINRVKIFDCHGYSTNAIAKKIKKYDTRLVIIDMIDHLSMKGASDAADWRRLQRLYYECRRLARDCPVIGASQCNASVTWVDYETQQTKFQHYISMKQLAGSGQGKQEAMDFMITIGKDEEFPKTRYIHVPKNKLPGDGNSKHRYIKSEVIFDEHTGRYTDLKF